MTFNRVLTLNIISVIILLPGCAGYNRALLATKTNVGLDVDSKPPTAELSIARREIAIQPTYPESTSIRSPDGTELKETALPLLASFHMEDGFFNPKITAHFAGGDAAVYLTKEDDAPVDSHICLNSKAIPDTRGPFTKLRHWLIGKADDQALAEQNKETRPFYFAADTTLGIKVAWSGTTGPYPDAMKLGYQRKEFASPPIFADQGCDGDSTKKNVKLPSFYASIQNESWWRLFKDSRLKQTQFFATGKAATELAKHTAVRQLAFTTIAPEAAEIEANPLNKSLIEEINGGFTKATDDEKQAITGKAIELQLVPNGTGTDTLIRKLQDNTKSANYSISGKLNELRIYINKI